MTDLVRCPSNISSASSSNIFVELTLSTSIEFPLHRKRSLLGQIVDPSLLLEVRTPGGYRGHRFLVDTGAELSAVPRRLSVAVGLNWDTLPAVRASGVGLGRPPARLGSLSIRLGGIELTVRCLFLDQHDAPYVLGCADVLDRFALTIDAGQGKIVFTEIA